MHVMRQRLIMQRPAPLLLLLAANAAATAATGSAPQSGASVQEGVCMQSVPGYSKVHAASAAACCALFAADPDYKSYFLFNGFTPRFIWKSFALDTGVVVVSNTDTAGRALPLPWIDFTWNFGR